MYSLNNVQLKHLSPILELEVPIRELNKAVIALITDHTDKSNAMTKAWGDAELQRFTAISNQQGEIAQVPALDDHDLTRAFYAAKSVFFGLAMKDVFLSAAIKGAVTCEEAVEYLDPSVRTPKMLRVLEEIGMDTLAKIVGVSLKERAPA